MSNLVVILLVIGCVLAAVVLWLIRRSPEGHQDRTGFHYGSADAAGSSHATSEISEENGNAPVIKQVTIRH